MTSYSLRKLMARATRARHAHGTAVARERAAYKRAQACWQVATDTYRRWQQLEDELAEAKEQKR